MEITIPDISNTAAAMTEWTACLLYWIYAPKRRSRTATALLAAVLLAGQIYLHNHIFAWLPSSIPGVPSGVSQLLIRALGVLCNALFMMGGTALLTAYSLRRLIYISAKALVTAELTASAVCLIYDLWVIAGGTVATPLEIVLYGAGCLVFLLGMREPIRAESYSLAAGSLSGSRTGAVVLIALSTFLVSNSTMIIIGAMETITEEIMLSRVILRLLGDLCGFMTLWLLERGSKEDDMRQELTAVKNTLNLQYQQYLTFRDTSEYISRQNHDLKHQIQALKESASEEERDAYIGEMERMIALNEAWNVTGNSTLDSILTQKKMYCIGHDIEFSCSARADELDQFAVRDICSLFGNIIDNAIDDAPSEQRRRSAAGGRDQDQPSGVLFLQSDLFRLGFRLGVRVGCHQHPGVLRGCGFRDQSRCSGCRHLHGRGNLGQQHRLQHDVLYRGRGVHRFLYRRCLL